MVNGKFVYSDEVDDSVGTKDYVFKKKDLYRDWESEREAAAEAFGTQFVHSALTRGRSEDLLVK